MEEIRTYKPGERECDVCGPITRTIAVKVQVDPDCWVDFCPECYGDDPEAGSSVSAVDDYEDEDEGKELAD